MPRALAAVSLASCALVLCAPHARAQERDRVVIVVMEGASFADWRAPGLDAIGSVLERGSLALVSTRTAYAGRAADLAGASALATIAAGARTDARPDGTVVASEGTPGVLGDSLARAGLRAWASDPSPLGFGPSGDPREADLVVVFAGRVARPEPAQREAAMRAIDGVAGGVLSGVGPADTAIVVSATPRTRVPDHVIRLAPIAVVGPGFEPGLLSSPTTRRQGVVALIDIAPTVLEILGVTPVAPTDGRAIVSHPRAGAAGTVAVLERDLVHAASVRKALTRHVLLAAVAAVALALGLMLAGARGRAAAHLALLGGAGLPLFAYVEGAFPTTGTVAAEIAVFASAFALAVAARIVVGRDRALLFVLGATALVIVADVAAGSPIGFRSGVGFQITIGARFYGVDEAVLGIVVGAATCAAALALDRWAPDRRALLVVSVALAACVVVLGSPLLGSKFGAPLTAVPAFAVLAVRAGSRRLTLRTAAAIAALTIAITGLFVVADALRPSVEQTHLGRAASGSTDLGDLARRKLNATMHITTSTIWTPVALAFAASILALTWRRRDAFDRGMFGRPHLRAALTACGVGAACAFAFNDGGVIASAPILLYAAVSAFAVLVVGGIDG